MKRILMIFSAAALLVILIPFTNVFADEKIKVQNFSTDENPVYYPEDYLIGVLDDPNINFETDFHEYWYDNDLDSAWTLNSGYVEFEEPIPIYAIYINSTQHGRRYTFTLKNGEEILYEQGATGTNYFVVDLEDVVKFEITRTSSFSFQIREIELFTLDHLEVYPLPDEIIISSYDVTKTSVLFNFDLPEVDNFSHIEIEFEDEIYTTNNSSYGFEDLKPDTSYEVTFYVVDDQGYKSSPVTINFKTDEEPPPPPVEETDIHNLQAEVSNERVDLSWNNPNTDEFEKAIIYRQTLQEGSSLSFLKPMTVSAFSPIFETDGTTFADLTVQQGTAYEYKVTAMINNVETEGATVRTSQIPIPPPIDMDEVELPFGAGALLQTVFEFVGILAPFILLVMAIYFAPRIINVIKNAAQQRMLKNDRLRR